MSNPASTDSQPHAAHAGGGGPVHPPSPPPSPPLAPPANRPNVVKVTKDLYLAAACRLVSQSTPDIEAAGRRLVSASGKHGIDLSLIWATIERDPIKPVKRRVRQACLAVLGTGKTSMFFLSEPPREGDPGSEMTARAERVACLNEACAYLSRMRHKEVNIAQALPDPADTWAVEAFAQAQFQKVGVLTYMRRTTSKVPDQHAPALSSILSPHEQITPFDLLSDEVGAAQAKQLFVQGLDRSYEQTLDCPELCGLRATADVFESHKATGVFDPRLWWLVRVHGQPEGCLLLNPCPEQRTIELVYIGLGPLARGHGLGKRLLTYGLQLACANRPEWDVACAVDERNTPAQKLYESLGFRALARRVAFVKPLLPSGE